MNNLNFRLVLAKIQSVVQKERDLREETYKHYPDANRYFAFIDLASSSNFRVSNGSEKGYFRGETFFSIVNAAIDPVPEVSLLKEIGDEVMLVSTEFRPLLESLIVINQVVKEMENVVYSERFPFKVRMAIGGGIAKRLKRGNEDYIGKCIDQLARLMGVRNESTNFLIHEKLYEAEGVEEIIKEYDFINTSNMKPLPTESSKGDIDKIYYREMLIDAKLLADYRKQFKYWDVSS